MAYDGRNSLNNIYFFFLTIMRLLIQQVQSATLSIPDQNIQRSIGAGIIIYLGIHGEDLAHYEEKIARIVKKIPKLKCLSDETGNISRCLEDFGGEVLLVSNFTLYGRSTKGTKMDFVYSAPYQAAKNIYDYFIQEAKKAQWKLQTGEFGADMTIQSVHTGPLNYVLDI